MLSRLILTVLISFCVCKPQQQIPTDNLDELLDYIFGKEPSPPETTPLIEVEVPEGCGYHVLGRSGIKLLNGTPLDTEFGEFPWMVALLKEEEHGGSVLRCGGSLIHPEVVLTSAECVQNKTIDKMKVRAGEWNFMVYKPTAPIQDRSVEQVVVHESYDADKLLNNVALIFLSTPFEMAENVRTICLPPTDWKFEPSSCLTTFWARDLFSETLKQSSKIQRINVTVVSEESCGNSLQKYKPSQSDQLNKSVFCAVGSQDDSTCEDDGGSPLICSIPGQSERFYQAGIVSRNIKCGSSIPELYTNVHSLKYWVDDHLSLKSLNSSLYSF